MTNYQELLDNNTLSKQQFLLNYYHLININETELVIILLIENMIAINTLVTTQELENMMSISKVKIENSLKRLIEKGYLCFDNHSTSHRNIDTSKIYEKIIDKLIKKDIDNNKEEQEKYEINIITTFEKEFSRKLSPFEIETIREWVETYNNELIIYALKEAVLYGNVNLKYIEKIIVEQARLLNG